MLPDVDVSRPLRVHLPNAFYHVISRGNGKQPIYTCDDHYDRFLQLLEHAAARFVVKCHSFCLMPNHFHLLLQPGPSPLSRMMQQLNSAYSQFFNRSERKVGHVLQGRYKAIIVDEETYFLQVLRYIVLNPVRAGIVCHPGDWRWSSYRALAGVVAAGDGILDLETVWRTFDERDPRVAQARFVAFVASAEPDPPSSTVFIGADALASRVAAAIDDRKTDTEFTYAERYATRPTLAALFHQSGDVPSIDSSMHAAYWCHAYTLAEIAAYLGCHSTTIAKRIKRLESKSGNAGWNTADCK